MSRRTDTWLALALCVGALVLSQSLGAATLGLTYDEPVYEAVGRRHLHWWGQVVRGDRSAWSHESLERGWGNSGNTPVTADWHPPLGKEWLSLCRLLPSPWGPFAQFRLGASLAFAGLVTLLFLWLAGAVGRTAGLGAALAALTLPNLLGHGSLAALDGLVACASTLALWLGWRLLEAPSRRAGVLFGVALGAAMATKFNGLMVVPAVCLAALGYPRAVRRPLVLALAVSVATFVLCWPWLWYNGLTHLRAVIAFHGRHGLIATEYFGRTYVDPPPPWHYPFVLLALTTPLTTLGVAALGAAASRRDRLARLLVLAAACHLLPFAAPHAAKYNGVRLFLPVLPLVAALCGLGLARAVGWVRPRVKAEPWMVPAVAGLVLFLPAAKGLLLVEPYPLAYYNGLVGGSSGADRRGFETAYWGEPFRGLALWLSEKAPRGARIYVHPPGAVAMVEMYRGLGLLRDDLKLVSGPEAAASADLFIYQNRRSEWDDLGRALARRGPPAFVLTAGDAPVGFVYGPLRR